jgi:hypothetical protein
MIQTKPKGKPGLFLLLLLLLFSVLSFSTFLPAAETQVSISVSDNLATIGDRIHLKIIVKTNADVDKITLKAAQKDFEVLDQGPTQKRTQEDYTVFEKDIQVAFFKVGEFNVGPFEIDLKKGEAVIETRETNSVPVTVKTVLNEEDKDIKPLKSLIEIKGNPFYIFKYVLIGVAIIVAVVVFIFWLRRRRRIPVKEVPHLSPIEELEAMIKELYKKELFEKGKVKQFFTELTQVLKNFLHRTYGINAEDFTTYETLYELMRTEKESAPVNSMGFLFNTSDLVKFAKFEPDTRVMTEISGKLEDTISIYKARAALELRKQSEEGKQQQTPPENVS